MSQPIRKAVILAAGYGTRFLPASKSVPKEMFPILDKPILQYVVDELIDAGIEQIIFVTSSRKKAVEDYFDSDYELEDRLRKAGKQALHDDVASIPHTAQFVYVRQKEPKGTGDAILLTKNIIGNEPFLVCFGDDLFVAEPTSRVQQLLDTYAQYPGVILSAIHSTSAEDAKKYGFAAGEEVAPGIMRAHTLIEKPGADKPSDVAVVSGCILPPEIFEALEQAGKAIGDTREVYYIDGINIIRDELQIPTYARTIENGRYFDCGNPLSYLITSIEMGLERDDMKEELQKYLHSLTN